MLFTDEPRVDADREPVEGVLGEDEHGLFKNEEVGDEVEEFVVAEELGLLDYGVVEELADHEVLVLVETVEDVRAGNTQFKVSLMAERNYVVGV